MGVRITFCFLCIAVFSQTAMAQRTVLDSVQILQDRRSLDVYDLTQNVIYVEKLRPQKGYASANFLSSFGDFMQPMQANALHQYKVATGGFRKISNWGYNGHFSYKKTYENDVNWSGVYNAYDDNPFIWADSSRGDWQRDEIQAVIGIIPPKITQKLSVGLQIEYLISSGARLSEPKPFYRFRDIALQPSISYTLENNQIIGINGSIGFVVEENELGFYGNTGNNVLLYRLRGYGTFSRSPFVNGERKRIQNDLFGKVHYLKKTDKYDFLIAASAAQRNDAITEGVALPQSIGFFTGIEYTSLMSIFYGNDCNGKSVLISASTKNGSAADVVFMAESASSTYQNVLFKLGKWGSNPSKKSLRQFSIYGNYFSILNADQATRTNLLVNKAQLSAEINYRKQLTNKVRVNATAETGYSRVLNNSFINQTSNTIIRNLIEPNYQFHQSNFALVNTKIGVDIIPVKGEIIHSITMTSQNHFLTDLDNFRTNFQIIYSIII